MIENNKHNDAAIRDIRLTTQLTTIEVLLSEYNI